jgi:hypothetical protein
MRESDKAQGRENTCDTNETEHSGEQRLQR